MSRNQHTLDEPSPPLTKNKLHRFLLDKKKRAGDLPKDQHVYTLDDVALVAKVWARHAANRLYKSKGSPRQKRNLIYQANKEMLAIFEEHKKLNKTP